MITFGGVCDATSLLVQHTIIMTDLIEAKMYYNTACTNTSLDIRMYDWYVNVQKLMWKCALCHDFPLHAHNTYIYVCSIITHYTTWMLGMLQIDIII